VRGTTPPASDEDETVRNGQYGDPPMELSTIRERLDERLHTAEYADVDASANGIQVGPSDREVERAACAVDAAVATTRRAAEFDADLLVTHHGVVWGGMDRLTGQHYRRIAPLVENDVALYVSHLPLDGHPELGNAAGLCDLLGVTDREPFGAVGPASVGQSGRLVDPRPAERIAEELRSELDTGDGRVRVLDFGPDVVEEVAVVTGSGTDYLEAAAEDGADLLVTGEAKGKTYHEAREAGIDVVLAGHYATETFGVRRLQDLLGDWGVETTFVDHPTGL
jgi:dinuclear metal center YbgI/SA1388 family protein